MFQSAADRELPGTRYRRQSPEKSSMAVLDPSYSYKWARSRGAASGPRVGRLRRTSGRLGLLERAASVSSSSARSRVRNQLHRVAGRSKGLAQARSADRAGARARIRAARVLTHFMAILGRHNRAAWLMNTLSAALRVTPGPGAAVTGAGADATSARSAAGARPGAELQGRALPADATCPAAQPSCRCRGFA